jgi:hypothetical protein
MELVEIPALGAGWIEKRKEFASPTIGSGISSRGGVDVPQGDFRKGMKFTDKTGVATSVKPFGGRKDTPIVRMVKKCDRDLAPHQARKEK